MGERGEGSWNFGWGGWRAGVVIGGDPLMVIGSMELFMG